jgi:hypothetical protein
MDDNIDMEDTLQIRNSLSNLVISVGLERVEDGLQFLVLGGPVVRVPLDVRLEVVPRANIRIIIFGGKNNLSIN